MRYRIDEDPTLSAWGTTDDFIVLSAIIGLIVGAFLTWLGWRGRQMWLTVWCGGLVIASIACLSLATMTRGAPPELQRLMSESSAVQRMGRFTKLGRRAAHGMCNVSRL